MISFGASPCACCFWDQGPTYSPLIDRNDVCIMICTTKHFSIACSLSSPAREKQRMDRIEVNLLGLVPNNFLVLLSDFPWGARNPTHLVHLCSGSPCFGCGVAATNYGNDFLGEAMMMALGRDLDCRTR